MESHVDVAGRGKSHSLLVVSCFIFSDKIVEWSIGCD